MGVGVRFGDRMGWPSRVQRIDQRDNGHQPTNGHQRSPTAASYGTVVAQAVYPTLTPYVLFRATLSRKAAGIARLVVFLYLQQTLTTQ